MGAVGSDEDVRDTFLLSCVGVLKLHALLADEVVLRHLDVRIKDDSDASSLLFNFLVHLGNLWLSEVLLVKFEVLIAIFS